MKKTIAIYARKSVERVDSISIESQIEFCKYEAKGAEYKLYSDNGYSGKNTDRPAFNTMMKDIVSNKISSVIVYKLDRISRSILDFSEMMEVFQEHNVQFISATEKFDTSSPMGRAMLNICIVFAQLERETIQQRVKDAYYSRSKKGFYMGGRIPYGYSKVDTTINGIRTSKYVIVPEEAEDLKMMYSMYSSPSVSLGDVLRELQKTSAYNKRGSIWSTARIGEMMRNPAYCRADYSVYLFFKSQKSNISNNPEDFNGINGLYLFKGATNSNNKLWDLSEKEIVVAPHEGIIDARTWLICRKKLMNNNQIKPGKAKNSWLVGLIKCGCCGYAMAVKKSRRKDSVVKYFCCTVRSSRLHVCDGIDRTIYVDKLESEIKAEIEKKINTLSITSPDVESDVASQIESYKIEIDKIESEISSLIDKLSDANERLMKYINDRVDELDKRKMELESKIDSMQHDDSESPVKKLINCMSVWDTMSVEDKSGVARLLIQKITLYHDRTHIEWKL